MPTLFCNIKGNSEISSFYILNNVKWQWLQKEP